MMNGGATAQRRSRIARQIFNALRTSIPAIQKRDHDPLHRVKGRHRLLERPPQCERITRDLHDLLGHTLSVIVLKSELASRLADKDPARAISEIRDV